MTPDNETRAQYDARRSDDDYADIMARRSAGLAYDAAIKYAAERAFWRTDGTYPSRTAAERRARAVRWSPTVIERGLAVAIAERPDGTYDVLIGANRADLLRIE